MVEINRELKLRIISAIPMIAVALLAIGLGGMWFAGLVLAGAVLMSFEWNQLVTANDNKPEQKWYLIGIAYVVVPCLALLYIREQGAALAFWYFSVIWALDIGAYFTGKFVGGAKLAPAISPGKTWSGLGGGVLAAMVVGGLIAIFAGGQSFFLVILASVLALLAQAGDLYESWIKRQFGLKDSSSLIPGHGGILDRVDGIVASAPILALVNLIFGPLL